MGVKDNRGVQNNAFIQDEDHLPSPGSLTLQKNIADNHIIKETKSDLEVYLFFNFQPTHL